jgi:hypothetical protein
MPIKTEAKDLGDFLENLGEQCAIRYVTPGSQERQFQVIGGPRFVQRVLEEFLQDASMLELDLVLASGQRVRLKRRIAVPAGHRTVAAASCEPPPAL